MTKVYFHTLGCDKNTADTAGMQNLLLSEGKELVDQPQLADAIVVNTCGFIQPAIEESVEAIVDACDLKQEHRVKVVVTGCLVTRKYQELKESLPEVDVFLGTSSYHKINRAIDGRAVDEYRSRPYVLNVPGVISNQSYAYVKISEGCSRACSFCTIPSFRGRTTSKPVDAILEELKALADQDVSEAILVSQDSTQYGLDLGQRSNLVKLLEAIDRAEHMPPWVRLHYTFPGKLVERVVPILAESDRFCSYLDMPIQHTNSEILASMDRPSDREWLMNFWQGIDQKYPQIWKRSTVIVGHPGETDDSVDQLCEDLETCGFDTLGVFPWWPEEHTKATDIAAADELTDDRQQIQTWAVEVSQVSSEISAQRAFDRIGQKHEVIVDSFEEHNGGQNKVWLGRTQGQSPGVDGVVYLESNDNLDFVPGQILPVQISDAVESDLYATVDNQNGKIIQNIRVL